VSGHSRGIEGKVFVVLARLGVGSNRVKTPGFSSFKIPDLAGHLPMGQVSSGSGIMIASSGPTGEANNPYEGPVLEPIIVVDRHGNAIPVERGQGMHSSPDGNFQQVIDASGKPTGDRMDRVGHPGQRDPAARRPHGHRPGLTTSNGNRHLPIKPNDQ
jgi:hypothetical protein